MNVAAAILVLASVPGQYQKTIDACSIDYKLAGGHTRYLTVDHMDEALWPDAELAANFELPHLSREQALAYQRAEQVPRYQKTAKGNYEIVVGADGTREYVGAYRIHLDGLGWSIEAWRKVASKYPYTYGQHIDDPLMLRLDWLLRQTADATASTAYYDLLLGRPPKDRADWLKLLDIDDVKEQHRQAQVIDSGKSPVAFNTRLVTWSHVASGSLAETDDSIRAAGKSDPFERQDFTSDARELIATIPKVLPDGERVLVNAYLLTDGKNLRVDFANPEIVKDFKQFLGRAHIRTPGSCFGCHTAFNGSKENLFVEYIKLPGEPQLYVKEFRNKVRFDAKFLGKLSKQITRANEDFEEWAQESLNEDPKDAAGTWRDLMVWYDSDLDIKQAAREVFAKSHDELRLAIAEYSSTLGPAEFAGRLTLLAEGGRINRHVWEDQGHFQATKAIAQWRARGVKQEFKNKEPKK